MKTARPLVAALVMLLGGIWLHPRAAARAQGDAAAPDVIHLDAIVTDLNERPIRDLSLSDFELSDNGEGRPIDSVTLESGRRGRLVAIFLDEYHVRAGENTVRARAALTDFVEHELRADDLVAIMKPLDRLNAIQITQNHDVLRSAIDSFAGRKGDYAPSTPFEREFMSRAPEAADASRAQVVSSALQALTMRIGGVRDGRKAIVLVSEGFAPSLARGSDRLMGSVRAIVYAANRYEVAIYPIDPQVGPDGTDLERATTTLGTLAEQTGGEATINRADLMPGMTQAVHDLDEYYMVTYRAARAGDGQFHPVQLRVKRRDAQIRIRSGYWAASPDLLRPALGPTARAVTMPVRPPHTSVLIQPWIGMSRGPNGLTSVTVTWEPRQAPPRNQHVDSIVLKATTDDGRVLFQDRLASRATFDAPPGHIQLEMTVQGDDGKTLDTDYRGMDVPNLRVTRPTFATLQIMRTRSAREFALVSADEGATPVSSREFSRAERLLIRIPIYGADETTPEVAATLLNRNGTPMRSLNLVPAALPAGVVQFDLPLSSLAPDDYRVELAVKGTAPEVKTVVLFRVTN
jgi:VWFA-related protein